MRLFLLALLLVMGLSLPVGAEESAATKAPDLPALGDLNPYIMKVLKTYPTDGTHDYHWPREGTWSGNVRTLYYDGKVLLKGDPKGRCYCCGLTFEVFVQAWQDWARETGRPGTIEGYDDPVAKRHARANMAERPDTDTGAQFGPGFDNRAGVNLGLAHLPGMSIIAMNSTSAARSPSTSARPSNFQILPPPRRVRTCSISWSPGTTLRRNLQLLMAMK